jgi:hypothetical protein
LRHTSDVFLEEPVVRLQHEQCSRCCAGLAGACLRLPQADGRRRRAYFTSSAKCSNVTAGIVSGLMCPLATTCAQYAMTASLLGASTM